MDIAKSSEALKQWGDIVSSDFSVCAVLVIHNPTLIYWDNLSVFLATVGRPNSLHDAYAHVQRCFEYLW